jgi:hypothetical protein
MWCRPGGRAWRRLAHSGAGARAGTDAPEEVVCHATDWVAEDVVCGVHSNLRFVGTSEVRMVSAAGRSPRRLDLQRRRRRVNVEYDVAVERLPDVRHREVPTGIPAWVPLRVQYRVPIANPKTPTNLTGPVVPCTGLEMLVATSNMRSLRAAEKFGATREGVLRRRLFLHGTHHDAVVFSLHPLALNELARHRWPEPSTSLRGLIVREESHLIGHHR